jgi:hypothetical protein
MPSASHQHLSKPADNLTPSTPAVGLFLNCNYSLHGLTGHRCPECGRTFDPHDVTTMNMGLPLEPWERRLLRPPGAFTFGCIVAACLWACWVCRNPAPYYMGMHILLLIALAVAAAAAWGIRVGLGRLVARARRQAFPPSGRRAHALITILALTAILIETHVPLYVGLLLARPGLEQILREIEGQSNPVLKTPRQAGPYVIGGLRKQGRAVAFIFADDAESSFVYDPDGNYSWNGGADGWLWGPWRWWKEN